MHSGYAIGPYRITRPGLFSYRSVAACAALALAICGALCQAVPAAAQQLSSHISAKTTASRDETTTVTVKGKKTTNKADRQVYDVSKNPDRQPASVADALNKVPGVSVDPSGNVTLRGQEVRIYLNGRPPLMLLGRQTAPPLPFSLRCSLHA